MQQAFIQGLEKALNAADNEGCWSFDDETMEMVRSSSSYGICFHDRFTVAESMDWL